MVLERVLKYIKKRKRALVYLCDGVIRCTEAHSKLAGIVINNKKGAYVVVGVYTEMISAAALADDLAEIGLKE